MKKVNLIGSEYGIVEYDNNENCRIYNQFDSSNKIVFTINLSNGRYHGLKIYYKPYVLNHILDQLTRFDEHGVKIIFQH